MIKGQYSQKQDMLVVEKLQQEESRMPGNAVVGVGDPGGSLRPLERGLRGQGRGAGTEGESRLSICGASA